MFFIYRILQIFCRNRTEHLFAICRYPYTRYIFCILFLLHTLLQPQRVICNFLAERTEVFYYMTIWWYTTCMPLVSIDKMQIAPARSNMHKSGTDREQFTIFILCQSRLKSHSSPYSFCAGHRSSKWVMMTNKYDRNSKNHDWKKMKLFAHELQCRKDDKIAFSSLEIETVSVGCRIRMHNHHIQYILIIFPSNFK